MKDDLTLQNSVPPRPAQQRGSAPSDETLHLRVLATTDVHMQLLGYDYVRDCALAHNGLAGIATLIEDARAEAHAANSICVLFDNGDLLQGSALGETLAQIPVTPDHPVLRGFREMSYDAWGFGNHDLDHGMQYPLALAAQDCVPVISSNLKAIHGPKLRSSLLLTCDFPQTDQRDAASLKLGVVSVLPDRTAVWNRPALTGNAHITPALSTLINEVEALREQGADLVVLLAHLGIDDLQAKADRPDDARSLAAVPGVDLVIAGHTHRRLPGADHSGFADVDTEKGTVSNRPAAMPGFDASDLAVLDLSLARSDAGHWDVRNHQTHLRPNTEDVVAHPKVAAIYRPAHEDTRRTLAEPIGHSDTTLQNYFSLLMPTATCALVAQAKKEVVAASLQGHRAAKLPLLATASAHTAGGRGGPDNFLCIPQGPVLRRHVTGLNPYANQICAVEVTGADIRQWLEAACSVFHRLVPDQPDQPLIQPHRPSFDFDTIFGLDYLIDPTRPEGDRIVALDYEGAPVTAAQNFLLATSQFRASGGGGGVRFTARQEVFHMATGLGEAIGHVLSDGRTKQTWFDCKPWAFACAGQPQAVIQTSPDALPHLDQIKHLQGTYLGDDSTGFARIRVSL